MKKLLSLIAITPILFAGSAQASQVLTQSEASAIRESVYDHLIQVQKAKSHGINIYEFSLVEAQSLRTLDACQTNKSINTCSAEMRMLSYFTRKATQRLSN